MRLSRKDVNWHFNYIENKELEPKSWRLYGRAVGIGLKLSGRLCIYSLKPSPKN